MKGKEKISMLTAYDYSTAKYMDEAGIDIILIGDSMGMVVLGYKNTLSVTINDIILLTGAVVRGAKNALIVGDLPAGAYDDNESAALNAEALIKSGADTVKLENAPEIAKFLVENKIEVMGHVGLTPQTVTDFKVQGKQEEAANTIIKMAKDLEAAGCYCIVLEGIPRELGKKISEMLSVPTIGIGAGPDCDGQVLVVNDMLGLFNEFKPKFVKKYANLEQDMRKAFETYIKEIKEGSFPSDEHSFH